jgi:hypothetical protein
MKNLTKVPYIKEIVEFCSDVIDRQTTEQR